MRPAASLSFSPYRFLTELKRGCGDEVQDYSTAKTVAFDSCLPSSGDLLLCAFDLGTRAPQAQRAFVRDLTGLFEEGDYESPLLLFEVASFHQLAK